MIRQKEKANLWAKAILGAVNPHEVFLSMKSERLQKMHRGGHDSDSYVIIIKTACRHRGELVNERVRENPLAPNE